MRPRLPYAFPRCRAQRPPIARLLLLLLIPLVCGTFGTKTAHADDLGKLTEAIEALSNELMARHDPVLAWQPAGIGNKVNATTVGTSTLALLALVESGRSVQEPELKPTFEKVLATEISATYALSLRIMLLSRLPKKYEPNLKRDVEYLLSGFSPHTNGWGYVQNPADKHYDNSTTQFAALALRDAVDAGIKVPKNLWRALELRFMSSQTEDGGWDYGKGQTPKSSMTAAAVATLAIVRRLLYRDEYDKGRNDKVTRLDDSIDRGLAWLDINFHPNRNEGRLPPYEYYAYYLVCIERAAHATGRARFGDHEWFAECVDSAVNRFCTRDAQGKLQAKGPEKVPTHKVALTLFFLHRGIMVNAIANFGGDEKLARPLATKELTTRIAKRLEARLNWIDLKHTAENPLGMHSMPRVLFVDLHANPTLFDDPDGLRLAQLRLWLQRGSTALVCVPGGARLVENAANALAEAIPGTNVVRIERTDSLMSEPWPVRSAPPAYELTNGVRALAVFVGADPARSLQRGGRDADRYAALFANAWLRANGGEAPTPRARRTLGPLVTPLEAGIEHLAPFGRALPEPYGLTAMLERREFDGRPSFNDRRGVLGEWEVDEHCALAIISGVDTWTPTEDEWTAIENMLAAGIPVLVETSGGLGDFAKSFASAAEKRTGKPIEPIGNLDTILGESLRERDLKFQTVGWTSEALQHLGPGRHPHRLEQVEINSNAPLLIARFDITHALLGQPALGTFGWQTPWSDALIDRFLRRQVKGAAETQ